MFLKRISFFILFFFYICSFAFAEGAKRNYFSELLSSFCGSGCLNNSISRVNFGNSFFPNFISKSFPNTNISNTEENVFLTNSKEIVTEEHLHEDKDLNIEEEVVTEDEHLHEDEDVNKVATGTDEQTEEKKDESLLCKLNSFFCIVQDKKNTAQPTNISSQTPTNSEPTPQNLESLMSDLDKLDPGNTDYSNRDESFYASPEYQALGNAVNHDSDNVYGEQVPLKDLDQSKVAGAFIDPGSGDCGNYGIILQGSKSGTYPANTLSSKIKLDTKKLCGLTGKKLVVTSGRRGRTPENGVCFPNQSEHNCGRAMDTRFDPFKTDEEKTIVMLYFMAHGYNGIGSYGLTVPIHIDHRNGPMRWGPGPGGYRLRNCAIRHWPNYAKQAFLEAKVEPCQLISTNVLAANAKAALIRMGKPQFAE